LQRRKNDRSTGALVSVKQTSAWLLFIHSPLLKQKRAVFELRSAFVRQPMSATTCHGTLFVGLRYNPCFNAYLCNSMLIQIEALDRARDDQLQGNVTAKSVADRTAMELRF
jgi:hypothetical protein